MAAEVAETNPRLRARLSEAFERKRALLAGRLMDLRQEGVLAAEADPEALATFLMASLQGGLLLASTFKQERALRDAVDEAWRHLLSFRV